MKHRWNQFLAGALCICFLTGCRGNLSISSDSKEIRGYSTPQTMIVVTTERNRYEEVYTDDLWNVTLEDGTSFEDYLLDQVELFLQNMKAMTLLAAEQGVELTSAEKDQLRRLSETYYNGLTPEDIAYMGIEQEDVLAMYQEYHLANKVVSELTKEMSLEVSDSEAKVITLQKIVLNDEETASSVYSQVTAENSDFQTIAKSNSVDPQIEFDLGRGEADPVVEDAVFALTAGEISPVIAYNGQYCIFKCISDYNEKATAERKAQLYLTRKSQAFQQIYHQFQLDHTIQFDEGLWESIQFSPDDKTTTTNFFSLYQEEFSSESH